MNTREAAALIKHLRKYDDASICIEQEVWLHKHRDDVSVKYTLYLASNSNTGRVDAKFFYGRTLAEVKSKVLEYLNTHYNIKEEL